MTNIPSEQPVPITDWHYSTDGKRVGPVTEAQIHDLIKSHQITAESQVWNKSMTDWQPILKSRFVDLVRDPNAPPPLKLKLSEKTWFHILMCVCFWPVGLYLVFKTKRYSKKLKYGIVAAFAGLFILGIIAGHTPRGQGRAAFRSMYRDLGEDWMLTHPYQTRAEEGLRRYGKSTWTEAEKQEFMDAFEKAFQDKNLDNALRSYRN